MLKPKIISNDPSVIIKQNNTGFAGGERFFDKRYPFQLVNALTSAPSWRSENMVIVDIGSATGSITRWVVEQDDRFRVLGLDRSEDIVDDARGKTIECGHTLADVGFNYYGLQKLRMAPSPTLAFHSCDVTIGVPLPNNVVEGFIIHKTRDGILDISARRALAGEMHRLLMPGGFISLVENMYVSPEDPDGDWYGKRYAVTRELLPMFMRKGVVPSGYHRLFRDPSVHLLFSLRSRDGQVIDDAAYLGQEEKLYDMINRGDVYTRGIGIHEEAEKVRIHFKRSGLSVQEEWHVLADEDGEQEGHLSVMKGMLFQKR
jgi:SAM-dependent methyltransferase